MKAATQPKWTPPQQLGEYVIERFLGGGEMGQVYLATDSVLARNVAIKFISAVNPSPDLRERFLVEARAAARLSHPNVAGIHRAGEHQGRPFIVSEYVEGHPLADLDLPLSEPEALRLGIAVARGLGEAHRLGVLHRDVKPANVLVTPDGSAKLVDFGLAKMFQDEPSNLDVSPSPNPPLTADLLAGTADLPAGTAATLIGPPSDVSSGCRSLTRAGTMLGTPDYMSPESWRGELATPRSDVYSVGALVYELVAGATPFGFVASHELRAAALETEPPSLGEVAPHASSGLVELVDACLSRDPNARPESGLVLQRALENLAFRPGGGLVGDNPYRGLEPFEAQHQSVFFGRELETEEIWNRLRRDSFVLVTGDSGTGKSSVCRASVLPSSAHSGLAGGRSWASIALTPGTCPLTQLAVSVAGFARWEPQAFTALANSDPKTAALHLQRALGMDRGLICFVDQIEELVTQAETTEGAGAQAFLAHLASGLPGVKVLATIRADFLTRFASCRELGPLTARGLYLLRPMSQDAVRRVIVEPARSAGVRFESETLVDELLSWTENTPSGLPILQFALSRWWKVRDVERRMLTREGLERVGGIAGALARHADELIASLLPNQRPVARHLLLNLVAGEGIKASRFVDELIDEDPVRGEVLNTLLRGRLVALHDADGKTTCSLVHDVLLREWGTLVQWVEEAKDVHRIRERLRSAATTWEREGRSPDTLASAALLRDAGRLEKGLLSSNEKAFLRASRRRRQLRRLGFALAALALPAVVVGVWGHAQMRARAEIEARIQAAVATSESYLAETQESLAAIQRDRAKLEERFAQGNRRGGEEAWSAVQVAEHSLGTLLRRRGQALETAVSLAPDRGDLRSRLGDLLLQRAWHARRNRDHDQVEEFVARLALYDPEGSRRNRLQAFGHIGLSRGREGVSVVLERYAQRAGRYVPEAAGTVPGRFSPGSYRASFVFKGRRWHSTFVLEPGASVELAAHRFPSRIPRGFIYVPKGKFLFGSTAEEEARLGFFDAPPLHPSKTDGFLIGRHEVTFEEWLTWLDSLPEVEARKHWPGMVNDEGLTTGGLRVTRSPAGQWHLEFKPGSDTYRAGWGERIKYADRGHRVSQDWRKFPVLAVTARDAEAYAQWLHRSGRVPGARLCSEKEWERAARGADDRRYPHGNRLLPEDANFDQTYAKKPGGIGVDEVGSHPFSTSPFGVADMVGNAFEWTTSSLSAGEYVLRGGSYFYDAATNRVPNRSVAVPTLRVASVGVRICASPAVPKAQDGQPHLLR